MGLGRTTILVAVLLLSLAPVAPCLALAWAPAGSALELALVAAAALAWFALLLLVTWWEFTGLWLRWVWTACLAAAVAWRAGAATLPARPSALLGPPGIVAGLLLLPALWLLLGALRARRPARPSVPLEFPLRGGRFLVTDGGDGARSFLVNYHFGFGRHAASGVVASMRYAVDVVEVDGLGRSARGLLPRRNEAWRIWDRPLHAPCDGVVAHAVGDVADNEAFGTHRPYGLGNHVVIRAGQDLFVVLGHLRQGSLRVRPGEPVRSGALIGRVGNSGWTERPHLHLQAMRAPDGDWWHGQPVAPSFAGWWPAKNRCFEARGGAGVAAPGRGSWPARLDRDLRSTAVIVAPPAPGARPGGRAPPTSGRR